MSITIEVERVRTTVVIDTGSAKSLVTPELASDLVPRKAWNRQQCGRLVTADGSGLKVLGMVELRLGVGDGSAHEFWIVGGLPAPMLLGNDLLEPLKTRIDYSRGVVEMGGRELPMTVAAPRPGKKQWSGVKVGCAVVRAVADTTIAAGTVAFVAVDGPLYAITGQTKGVVTVHVQPIKDDAVVQLPKGCLVAGMVTNFTDGKGYLQVYNSGKEAVTVCGEANVALVSVLTKDELEHSVAANINRSDKEGPVMDKDDVISPAEIHERVRRIGGLTQEQRKALTDLLLVRRKMFVHSLRQAGKANVEPLDIQTLDPQQQPIRGPTYRMAPREEQATHKEIDSMLQARVVQPSRSPWNAPVIIVPKKDGSLRFCVDYRRLNDVTAKETYPMPRIDRALEELRGNKYFSSFDLASGYWQVPLTEQARELTAFSVPGKGHFEFTVVPMGATNAPAHFQRCMDLVLAGLAWTDCLVYLDDIIIYGRTFSEHLQRLDAVLGCLDKAGLVLKWTKCRFALHELGFLGHLVSGEGVKPLPDKVAAIANCAIPANVKQLRAFIGMVNHFRRFIHCCSERMAPLTRLTSTARAWAWGAEEQRAFDDMRKCLTMAPVLRHADFSKPFVLMCDSSKIAISGVLMQPGNMGNDKGAYVVEYFSRMLSSPERNYGIPARELLAVQASVKHFHRYVYGSDVTVWTDQQSLVGTLQRRRELDPDAASHLVLKLQPYLPYMTVRWLAGKKNVLADALTRAPFINEGALQLAGLAVPGGAAAPAPPPPLPLAVPARAQPEPTLAVREEGCVVATLTVAEIRQLQRADKMLRPVIECLEAMAVGKQTKAVEPGVTDMASRSLLDKDGVLHHTAFPRAKGVDETPYQLAVPAGEWRKDLIAEYHDGPFGSHMNHKKTLARLQDKYWWPAMGKDVILYADKCPTCLERREPHKLYGSVQPFEPVPRFQRWFVDFGEQLPVSDRGNQHVLVMVEATTRLVLLHATKTKTAVDAVEGIVRCIFARYGAPPELVSDQGPAFAAGLTAALCQQLGTKQRFSVAHHPQSHGLVERTIRTVWDLLSSKVSASQRNWDNKLWEVEATLQFTPNESTGITPFKMLHGIDANMPADVAAHRATRVNINEELVGAPVRIAEAVARRTAELEKLAATNSTEAKKVQKEQHDKHVKAPDAALDVGKLVMWAKPSATNIPGTSAKLMRRWDGPFKITAKPSEVDRVIQDTRNEANKFTVHIERLKPFTGELEEVPEGEAEVEEIMQQHSTEKDGDWYRVRWAGYTRRYDTWQREEALANAPDILREFKKRPLRERLRGLDNEGKTTRKSRPWT
jgi:hypothetical protein